MKPLRIASKRRREKEMYAGRYHSQRLWQIIRTVRRFHEPKIGTSERLSLVKSSSGPDYVPLGIPGWGRAEAECRAPTQ